MKFAVLILFLLSIDATEAQCVSNDSYKLYWHRYVIEFDSTEIAVNNIQRIEAKSYEVKRGKLKNERKNFELEFNQSFLPKKYTYYQEFNLRNGLKYNPFWRKKNEYPLYSFWQYEFLYDSLNRLKSVIQKEKGAHAVDTTYTKIEFQYDSLGRVILQREFQFFTLNIKGKDTVFESTYEMDSSKVIYNTDSTGIVLSNSMFRQEDTTTWVNSPVQYALFNFGDTLESFIRNIPFDRNTSLYYAIDVNTIIDRNDMGMRKTKILNRDSLSQNEVVNLPKYTMIVYEYDKKETP
jgi:hypothetical protein